MNDNLIKLVSSCGSHVDVDVCCRRWCIEMGNFAHSASSLDLQYNICNEGVSIPSVNAAGDVVLVRTGHHV